MAHKSGHGLHNLCRFRGPQHFRAGEKVNGGPDMGGLATTFAVGGVPHFFKSGENIIRRQQVGSLPTESFTFGGPQRLRGVQIQRWPRSWCFRYIIPAMWFVPNASEKWTNSVIANKWEIGQSTFVV